MTDIPGAAPRHGRRRGGGHARPRLAAVAAGLVVVLAAYLAVIAPRPGALAVTGVPAVTSNAQVRIFENGVVQGGGTLVGPNWVLTAAHMFQRPDNPAIYSLRFGVVDSSGDGSSTANLRTVDRIVFAPAGDVAMVHFAQAVPRGTWIPRLAEQAPARMTDAELDAWGPDGSVLHRALGVVYDPVASENAAHLRPMYSIVAEDFPEGIDPMVTTFYTGRGDSGSGVFTGAGTLTGVHVQASPYQDVNASGNLAGDTYILSWEEPVWSFRQWVQDTMDGTGSSGTAPHDELRKLTEAAATLVMTNPPQSLACDESDPSCTGPVWEVGTLTASSGSQGLTQVTCAKVASNACTLNGAGVVPGAPGQEYTASGQQAEAWCQTTDTFTPGGAPQPAVRVSFTNANPAQPVNYGWWDISAASFHTTADPNGAGTLATC